MNSNRSNNRRRGRSNRGQGGGNQANRIDSRARGNAPQMLEKYKKLAHDASLNGDRVQAEYYLQFADHYFRVLADMKSQKDEQQQQQRGRRDDRDQDEDEREGETEEGSSRRQASRGRRRDSREDEGDRGSEGEPVSGEAEDEENPFVRESKPRRTRRNARANGTDEAGGLDPESLPPAIGAEDKSSDEEARPRRRTRRTREASGEDETLKAVG